MTRRRSSPLARSLRTRWSANALTASSFTSVRCATSSVQFSGLGSALGAATSSKFFALAALVRDDEESIAVRRVVVVLDRVLVTVVAGRNDPGLALRGGGRHEPHFGRELRADVDEDEPTAPRAFDTDVEPFVVLSEDTHVGGRRAYPARAATPRSGASLRRVGRRSTYERRRPTRGRTSRLRRRRRSRHRSRDSGTARCSARPR